VEYALHRGVSKQAVYKAIGEGRIQLVQGRIDRDTADREWGENSAPAGGSDAGAEPGAGETAGSSYNRTRTLATFYRAQLVRLQYEEKAGRLIDAEKVRLAAFEQARRLREKIMALPARLAPRLAATRTRADVERILRAELRAALEEGGLAAGEASSASA
jgi:hypothetical protein